MRDELQSLSIAPNQDEKYKKYLEEFKHLSALITYEDSNN
ncbi:hypothetical protein AS4_32050 [Acinetobacter guillouiae]|nr:hypothetical protein AS4_32050 [Acinetobacter guillouiae]